MTDDKTYYECSYLLPPILSEEEALVVAGDIKNMVAESRGLVESSDEPRRIPLAYEIGGGQEAYVGSVRMTVAPDAIHEIEERLREEKRVMRFLIVRWERQLSRKASAPRRTYTPKKEETGRTDVSVIDQRLEEILDKEPAV